MNITFIEYLRVMALPGVAGLSSFLMLLLIFRRELKLPLRGKTEDKPVLKDKTLALISLIDLALCVTALTLGSYLNIQMWVVSLIFALLLLAAALILKVLRKQKNHMAPDTRQYVRVRDMFRGLPYSVIPFLLSTFIAVLTLEKLGVTHIFSDALFSVTESIWGTGFLFGLASALCSNVINNIPMSILFTSVLSSGATGANLSAAIYSSVIGSNIGAFFSPIGALAGVMFMKILKEKGGGFGASAFIKYCAPVAVVSLAASVLVLILIL